VNQWKAAIIQEVSVASEKNQAISQSVGRVTFIGMASSSCFVRGFHAATHPTQQLNRPSREIFVGVKTSLCTPRSIKENLAYFFSSRRIVGGQEFDVDPRHFCVRLTSIRSNSVPR
jgi:hypothetical protein